MSDSTPKLIETIIERLEQSEVARLDAEVAKADREAVEQEKRLKIEEQLVETGQQVRDRILEHYVKRHSRRANWFGSRVLKLTFAHDPGLQEVLKRMTEIRNKEIEDNISDPSTLKELFDKNSWDFQSTIKTPLLLVESGPVKDEHRFTLGWKFGLKDGTRSARKPFGTPAYSWRSSPLYIYRSAKEIHSGEEADELAYIMLFPGDMHTQKEPELKSFTDGAEDDALVMAGKDAHLHVLGLMQEGFEELSFRRRK